MVAVRRHPPVAVMNCLFNPAVAWSNITRSTGSPVEISTIRSKKRIGSRSRLDSGNDLVKLDVHEEMVVGQGFEPW